ncbi:MAG TPA: alpha/beta hydrolase-fold protein, partial [Chthoniobacterales bacterium]
MRFRLLCLLALFASVVQGSSPHKEVVTFSLTNNVGFGNSIFVVGNHPDLGAGDVTHALKLRYTDGNVWTGQIAVQAGTQLQYQYIKRSTAQDSWCDATNTTNLTGTLSLSVPAQPPAPFAGKKIYYLSSWSAANFFYRNGANFVTAPMLKIGGGRTAGESLFCISGVGAAGETVEFVFNDGNNHWDNPPGGGNYLTNLDVFEVEDGNVFSYQPPATFSAPHILTHTVDSSAPNIPGRTVRIYLPRGYDQNLTRRYPVIYLHDGQNVFDPGGPFGSWSADATATREMGQGRMREAILVGIDNDSARIPEYQPPNDSYQGTQGRADAYASFVINNVRPYVDTAFRTLNDPKNTVTIGSSMGGLVSLYLGREFSTFGKIAVMSPALWISPNYIAQVNSTPKKPLRVHLD